MKLPLSIVKAYIRIPLTGLDYLHTECRVVHTGKCFSLFRFLVEERINYALRVALDLKLENILITFENERILPAFKNHQTKKLPMQYKLDAITGRTVYRCHNDFGLLDGKSLKHIVPKIADFGLATELNNKVRIHIIQADCYRAPEVILGCGWDSSADIWNFGVMVRICCSGVLSTCTPCSERLICNIHQSKGIADPICDRSGISLRTQDCFARCMTIEVATIPRRI